MTLCEAVAKRIDELLEHRQITQYRLFKLSGVSESTISYIRKVKNKSVNLRIIYEISAGLGISLIEFFDSPLFDFKNITD